ncbi:MAG: alpha-amylase family protein [Planctomycetota bacterium]|jgi:hypothetical protein
MSSLLLAALLALVQCSVAGTPDKPAKPKAQPAGEVKPASSNKTSRPIPDWARNASWYCLNLRALADLKRADAAQGQTDSKTGAATPSMRGGFADLATRLPYLKRLGVNALLINVFADGKAEPDTALTGAARQFAALLEAKKDGESSYSLHPSFKQFLAEARRQGFRIVVGGVPLDAGVAKLILDSRWYDPDGDPGVDDGVDGWLFQIPDRPAAKEIANAARVVREQQPDIIIVGSPTSHESTPNCASCDLLITPTAASMRKAYQLRPSALADMADFLESYRGDPRLMALSSPGGLAHRNLGWEDQPDKRGDDAVNRLQLLLGAWLLAQPHPVLRYGDESGMQFENVKGALLPMRGAGAEAEKLYAQVVLTSERADLFEFLRLLIERRNDHASLRRGDFKFLWHYPDHKVFAFRRQEGMEEATVVINYGDQKQKVTLDTVKPNQRAAVLSPQMKFNPKGRRPFVMGGSRQRSDSDRQVTFPVNPHAMRIMIVGYPDPQARP